MQKSIQTGFDKVYCYPNTHVLKNKLKSHHLKLTGFTLNHIKHIHPPKSGGLL